MAWIVDTAIAFLIVIAASAVLTGLAIPILRRRAILDQPNERSSHSIPTPRGGGWGVMLALLGVWIWAVIRAGRFGAASEILLLLGVLALMAVSWLDDRRGLGALPRFAAQIGVITLVLAALPADLTLTGGWMPILLDRIVAGIGWLWFVNLFNFMDGIDGLAGGSAAAMGVGLMLVWQVHGPNELEAFRGAMIAAAAIGFLAWNWHPARVFLGDVGSVPIGYLLGYALLRLAMDGGQGAALIIALYYLADATLTLLRRATRGERVWRAHKEHFYQKAVSQGRSHAEVARAAILVQFALAALAWAMTVSSGWWPLPAAFLLVASLLVWMARPGKAA